MQRGNILIQRIDYSFDIPVDEYKKRAERVREEMVKRDIDLAIAWGLQLFPGDIIYLTGFDINLEIGAMILMTQDDVYLLTGPEAYPAAKIDIKNGEPFGVSELGCIGVDYSRTPEITNVKDCIKRIFKNHIPKRVAILTFPDFLTTLAYNAIISGLSSKTEIIYATDILYSLRMVKSASEQKLMKYAASIAIEGMKTVLNNIKPGMMETQCSAHACFKVRDLGAHALTFDPIIQSGRRINTSIGKTYNKIIEEGDIVAIDVGCRYKHYAGHVARTIVAGNPSEKQLRFLQMGAEACAATGSQVIYGKSMSNMDKASHEVFIKYGYGQYDTYSCGHGTGFTDGIGEGTATQKSEELWPKNIVMMSDVSLSGVPELHGFRFEECFLIDNNGITNNITNGLPLDVFQC